MKNRLRIASGPASEPDPSLDAVRERLKEVLKGQSCRTIAMRTGTHPETVRRYLAFGHPSVEFVGMIAREYGISGDWLLLGIGTARPQERVERALRDASLPRLLRGIADKLAAEEIDVVPQSRESRLRMSDARRALAETTISATGLASFSTST